MQPFEVNQHHYVQLVDDIQKRRVPSPEERFLLVAHGNALANKKGWELLGMDAIHYALMQAYSWTPRVIDDLTDREKGLALYNELQGLILDPDTVRVWQENFSRNSHMTSSSLFELWYPNGDIPEV